MSDCPLRGSLMCRTANNGRTDARCENCGFSQFSEKQLEKAVKHNDFMMTLLPEEGVSSLEDGGKCLFCRGKAENAEYIAGLGLAHSEPARTKNSFLGFGGPVRSQYGSLTQVWISCCPKCRRRMFFLHNITVALTILGLVAGIVAANFVGGGITESIRGLLLIAACALLGLAAGTLLKRLLLTSKSSPMITDLTEIELLRRIKALGWRFYTGSITRPYSSEKTDPASVAFMWQKKQK